MKFENEVAVVTGAGGTLCSVIAVEMARLGAKVVLIGRTKEKLEKTAKKNGEIGGTYRICPCDGTDEKAMQEVADTIEKEWGPCRFLINGAGGNNQLAMTTGIELTDETLAEGHEGRNFFDLDMDIFDSVLRINTTGTVIACRVFGKQMAKVKQGGILNFASMNTYCPLTRVPAYAMSKAAIANFTQWLASYFAPMGIRVNAVAPGFFVNERSINYLGSVETGLTARGQSVINHTPMGRFGEAIDLWGCVKWLLNDDEAAFVSGITVPVDGAFLTRSGV